MLRPGQSDVGCRCGARARPPLGAAPGEFVVGPTGSWPQPGGPGTPLTLTYGFVNYTRDIPVHVQRAAIEGALGRWSAFAPLSFTETADTGLPWDDPAATVPDIRIGWFSGVHGDGFDFDGPAGTLAHGFFPPPNGSTAAGDIHFDDDESWADGPGPSAFDLNEVAAHEVGHALGLDHEDLAFAVMQPTYTGAFAGLLQDDIDGIRTLYGTGSGTVAPMPFPAPFDTDLDWRVTTREVLAYAAAFVSSTPWPEHRGSAPTVDHALRAAAIWKSRNDGGYLDLGGDEPSRWSSAVPPPRPATE